MQKISLEALGRQQIKLAATAGGRHTADTVYGGHEKVLRQTVIGMIAGARLAEQANVGFRPAMTPFGALSKIAGAVTYVKAKINERARGNPKESKKSQNGSQEKHRDQSVADGFDK